MLDKQIQINNGDNPANYGSINTHNIGIYEKSVNLLQRTVASTSTQSIGESKMFNVMFNMTNGIMMVVLVGVPYVFHCGLFTSIVLLIVFAFITLFSLQLLIVSAQLCNVENYEDLCEYCFGLNGYMSISISLLLADFGCCVSNLIILKDAIAQITSLWSASKPNGDDMFIFLFISWFIIFPSCIPSDISKIETISKFSIVASVLIGAIVVTRWIQISHQENHFYIAPDIDLFININALPQSLGITAFLFVCQDCSFLIYNTLENASVSRWRVVTTSACLIAATMYASCGVFGYLLFGNELKSNILNNFGANNVLIMIAVFIYGLTAALTYPIAFFVVRHVCYSIVYRKSNAKINEASFGATLLFTLPIFALCLSFGIYFDDLGIVMSLSGSIPAVVISFIMPSLCYIKAIKLHSHHNNSRQLQINKTTLASFALLLFGILVAVFSTLVTLMQQTQ